MKDDHLRRTMLRAGIIIICLTMSIRLGRQTYELLKVKTRLSEAEENVRNLAQNKEQLEIELQHKKSGAYIERQIRDKLHLSRSVDIVIDLGESFESEVNAEVVEDNDSPTMKTNWQKWQQILFN